jgi:hypothetical protein
VDATYRQERVEHSLGKGEVESSIPSSSDSCGNRLLPEIERSLTGSMVLVGRNLDFPVMPVSVCYASMCRFRSSTSRLACVAIARA